MIKTWSEKTERIVDLLPIEKVDNVEGKLQKNKDIITQVDNFIGMVSLRRYVSLINIDLNESVDLFEKLSSNGFVINQNPMNFGDVDTDSFFSFLGKFGINPSDIGSGLLMKQLKDEDELYELYDKELEGQDELTFHEALSMFTLQGNGISMEDMPNVNLLFTIQKALIAKNIAELNIEAITNGKDEIYEVLPALR